jgi:carbon-monoxide dehydrogenase small subunit
MEEIELSINGETYSSEVEPGRTLRDFLRYDLGLTGTKEGCATGKCGVCTVLLDGSPVKSCLMLAHQADGEELVTIEGLNEQVESELHPVQQSFADNFASQCGYCIPGMVMTSVGLLEGTDDLSREEIREQLNGNICRCTGYRKIVDAVEDVSNSDADVTTP